MSPAFKTILLHIFTLGILNCTSAQKLKNVESYYSCVNNAELAIVDSNYDDAKKYYRQAFAYKYPNYRDLNNAFLLSFYTLDTASAILYNLELAYGGESRLHFHDSAFNPGFYTLIYKSFDSAYVAGARTADSKKLAFFSDILNADQHVRTSNVSADEYEKSDSANIAQIGAFISKNGFPSFKRMGVRQTEESIEPMMVIWLALWHRRPLPKTPIDSLLIRSVLDGDFPPQDRGTITMARNNADDYNYHMKLWLPLKDSSTSAVSQIDSTRATIYLENLADYRRKFEYALKYPKFNGNERNKGIRYSFDLLNSFLAPSLGYMEYEKSQHR